MDGGCASAGGTTEVESLDGLAKAMIRGAGDRDALYIAGRQWLGGDAERSAIYVSNVYVLARAAKSDTGTVMQRAAESKRGRCSGGFETGAPDGEGGLGSQGI